MKFKNDKIIPFLRIYILIYNFQFIIKITNATAHNTKKTSVTYLVHIVGT